MLAVELARLYPFVDQEPALRAVLAALAGLVVFKEAFSKEDAAPIERWSWATLAFCAVAAFATYYHFGIAQFFDEAKGRRTLVHTLNMRHDFPTAKYFRELRFDGLNRRPWLPMRTTRRSFSLPASPRCACGICATTKSAPAGQLADEMSKIRSRFPPSAGRNSSAT